VFADSNLARDRVRLAPASICLIAPNISASVCLLFDICLPLSIA
jgi:hypothetical protein